MPKSTLTMKPTNLRSRHGGMYLVPDGEVFHYAVVFTPPLPEYSAFITNEGVSEARPDWTILLDKNGVLQVRTTSYETAAEALAALQQEFT